MSIEKKIGNTTYKVPVNGENRWGERMTSIIVALIDVVNKLIGPYDILTREAILTNGRATPQIVNGFRFDTNVVQNIRADGVIVREFTEISAKSPTQDTFVLEAATYKGNAEYSVRFTGSDTKVKLILENNGQVYYTSENVQDTESLFIKFYAKAIAEDQV